MVKEHESSTWVEVGGYLYKDPGRARAALHVGKVNEKLQLDEAEEVIRMKKIRVTMNVSEDKSVQPGKVYEKDIEMVQEVVGESPTKNGKGNPYDKDATPGMPGTSPSGDDLPAWGKVLKNFVDKLSDNQQAIWIVIVGVAILAAISLGLTLLG